jgi:hypothetical protein
MYGSNVGPHPHLVSDRDTLVRISTPERRMRISREGDSLSYCTNSDPTKATPAL